MRKPRGFESLTRYKNLKIYLMINICREISVDYFFIHYWHESGFIAENVNKFNNGIYFLYIKKGHIGVYSPVGLIVTEYTPSYYDQIVHPFSGCI